MSEESTEHKNQQDKSVEIDIKENDASESDKVADPVAERDHIKEQLLRTAADFDNFRKRSLRELEDARNRSKAEAVLELLPVFDNLERAVSAANSESATVESVMEGVSMVLRMFEDTVQKLGIQRISTQGVHFDPSVHDAIQQTESSDHPPGTIVSEIQSGYRMGDRVIRAALVVVAKAPASQPPKEN